MHDEERAIGSDIARPPILTACTDRIQSFCKAFSEQTSRITVIKETIAGESPPNQPTPAGVATLLPGCPAGGQLGMLHDSLGMLEDELNNLRARINELNNSL